MCDREGNVNMLRLCLRVCDAHFVWSASSCTDITDTVVELAL